MKRIIATGIVGIFMFGCAETQTNTRQVSYLEKINRTVSNPYEVKEKKIEKIAKVIEEEKEKVKKTKIKEESVYEKEKKNLMVKMIKNPPTPIKTPEKILRVLILSYVDKENVLHTHHFSFIKVDDGSWILGDYLIKEGKIVNRHLSPLGGK